MRLCLYISTRKTGRAMRRVGRDSEFANSADLILEAGGLRKILPIKLRDTNVVERIDRKATPPKVW